jgi:hydroxymethylpyrimidine kinase/phosphomethylpyrimidine kinase
MRSGRARPVALTIGGTDSCGGAGVSGDLKTFEAHGVWGALAVTAVTAQDTTGSFGAQLVTPEFVELQIRLVGDDVGVDAAKTGMLGSARAVTSVADALRDIGTPPLVVDPVLVATAGHALLDPDAVGALAQKLLPLASVVTPNLAEAQALSGIAVEDRNSMERAARAIAELGPRAVLVTGGHLVGERSPDCLFSDGELRWLDGTRVYSPHTHGSGCVLSAAICAELARGMDAVDACIAGKRFVEGAIAAGFQLGGGPGPVDPGWRRR